MKFSGICEFNGQWSKIWIKIHFSCTIYVTFHIEDLISISYGTGNKCCSLNSGSTGERWISLSSSHQSDLDKLCPVKNEDSKVKLQDSIWTDAIQSQTTVTQKWIKDICFQCCWIGTHDASAAAEELKATEDCKQIAIPSRWQMTQVGKESATEEANRNWAADYVSYSRGRQWKMRKREKWWETRQGRSYGPEERGDETREWRGKAETASEIQWETRWVIDGQEEWVPWWGRKGMCLSFHSLIPDLSEKYVTSSGMPTCTNLD